MAEFYTDTIPDQTSDSRDRRSLWSRMKEALKKPFRSSARRAADQVREGARPTASVPQMRRQAEVRESSWAPHEPDRSNVRAQGSVRSPDLVSYDQFTEQKLRASTRRYGRSNDALRFAQNRQFADQVVRYARDESASPLVHPIKVSHRSIVEGDGIHSRPPGAAERAEQDRLDAGFTRVEQKRAAFAKGQSALDEMKPRHPKDLGKMHLYPDTLDADLDYAKALKDFTGRTPKRPWELSEATRHVNEFGEVMFADPKFQRMAESYHNQISEIGARAVSRPVVPERPQLGQGNLANFERDVAAYRSADARYQQDKAHYDATEGQRHPFESHYRQDSPSQRAPADRANAPPPHTTPDQRRAAMIANRPGRGVEALGI